MHATRLPDDKPVSVPVTATDVGTLLADAMACRSLNYTDLKRVCGSNPILGVCQGFPACETSAHLESVLGRRP